VSGPEAAPRGDSSLISGPLFYGGLGFEFFLLPTPYSNALSLAETGDLSLLPIDVQLPGT
jgi:hypothetical protein